MFILNFKRARALLRERERAPTARALSLTIQSGQASPYFLTSVLDREARASLQLKSAAVCTVNALSVDGAEGKAPATGRSGRRPFVSSCAPIKAVQNVFSTRGSCILRRFFCYTPWSFFSREKEFSHRKINK